MEETEIYQRNNTKGMRYHLRQFTNAAILAGIFLLFTGLYYAMIKAGIPYQDPPLELQIEYTVNMRIGGILLKNGFMTIVGMGILRLILEFIWKKQKRK